MTNSSFRTRAERDIVRKLQDAGTLQLMLGEIGCELEVALELMEDPNSIPTSVRKALVAHVGGA